ncbi:hypothetical protein ACFYZ9_38295 [Streptomyces sp. NPDC001691]|uniref:hypothetical protein n=1 Tax=Streptomyces sp. NPDC001691 TaxID=3364600 RepID=UPI00367DA943
MASTYEGAAKAEYEAYSDPYAYSVRLVDADQNRADPKPSHCGRSASAALAVPAAGQ